MSETPYYQKNIYVMLNGAKDYYKSDKVRFREEAWDKYRNLSKEEKKHKRENMEKPDIIIYLKKKNKI